jgi:hypothetical protein
MTLQTTSKCTSQLNSAVRLYPTRALTTLINESVLVAMYARNDHLHGRFPVYKPHSKSKVVKYSHLSQTSVSQRHSSRGVYEASQIQARKGVYQFHEVALREISQSTL